MKRLILLILILGLLAFLGYVTVDERPERWIDGPVSRGHWVHHEAKTKKTHKEPKGKREPKAKHAPEPPRPPKPPAPPEPDHADAPWEELKIRTITGRVSATEERARADARRELEAEVSRWLEPEVPPSWRPRPPTPIVGVRITPTEKPYGTVYTAEIDADFSDSRRAEIVRAYHQDVVRDRLFKLGGLFAFVLICLAAVSAYIRADEVTKGYHTTRLRLLATVAIVAAGFLLYLLLA